MLKRSSLLIAATLAVGVSMQAPVYAADTITGAGATFPYPVYSKWADTYQNKTGVGLNFQAIGSGGGIRQIEARTVTFGASDAPLTESDQKSHGLVQWPMIMGGAVPVANIDVPKGKLRLDGPTLAAIYDGQITKWNDPHIVALNPGLKLPDENITPVYRSDASGTNFNFTHYLSQVSSEFKNTVGEGQSVGWPSGVGAQANGGVASMVGRIKGAIGYVEYAYAVENHLDSILLKNRAGNFVAPNAKSFAAAASHADWISAPGLHVILTNQPGADSWPLTATSYILMPTNVTNAADAKQALTFFNWAYEHGQADAESLAYVPMPQSVVNLVKSKVWSQIKSNGKPVWNQ
ncbi:Phosphate-binding protein PstS [Halomonadaceae bacterium LMG 33818]|uniref:phosphate ABC transporter substrate-binding protein PstS n=1 Tax=Cernens ardua TaxID=3402176 RepID=UPI003EDB9E3F